MASALLPTLNRAVEPPFEPSKWIHIETVKLRRAASVFIDAASGVRTSACPSALR